MKPKLPAWWRHQYVDSAILNACRHHGMSADQALVQLHQQNAELMQNLKTAITKLQQFPVVTYLHDGKF